MESDKAKIKRLKQEIDSLYVENSKLRDELGDYKKFSSEIFMSSVINLRDGKYTGPVYLIQRIQAIWQRNTTPFLIWENK